MAAKDLNDTTIGAAYARACYKGGYEANKLQCSTYTTPAIDWTATTDAACPFDASMWLDDKIYKLDTGFINSHTDLGIHSHHNARVNFRKVTTCAPIKQQGYVKTATSDGLDGLGAEGDIIRKYQYGGYSNMGFDANTTYFYNQHAYIDGFGYELNTIVGYPDSSAWLPIPEIHRDDADVTLVFLAANAIKFLEPNSDPLFSANFKVEVPGIDGADNSYYSSDEYVDLLACTDQFQYCDAEDDRRCTPLTGYMQAWTAINATGMNSVQGLVANRIALYTRELSIHHAIGGRGAAALRAQELVSDRTQQALPDNQWQIEVSSWFATGLAKLQRAIVEYASGPSHLVPGTYVQKPDGPISEAMCYAQKVAITANTVSFSVLGLSLVLAIGAVIIFVYLVLETVVALIQKRLRWGDYRRLRWVMDDKMQLQRMAFEEAGMGGSWSNLTGAVPVTGKGAVFGSLSHVDPEEPRLGTHWTVKEQHSSASTLNGGGQHVQMQSMPAYDPANLGQGMSQQSTYYALPT